MAEPTGAPGVEPTLSAAESIAVVRDSESGRLLQPVRHGGRAGSPAEFVTAVADLAERDGSAGWLAAAVNAAAYLVAGLGGAAAERVWGADAAALVTADVEPQGQLTARDGRFRLTGRWESVTGAHVADWLLLGAVNGGTVRYVLVPRVAAQVDRTVGLHGLEGAGISDVTVSDTPVDNDCVISPPDDDLWGTVELDDMRPPYAIVAGVGRAAAVVGAAHGVWRAHVGQVRGRLATSYGSEDTTELTSSAVLVAKAESDIDAARLQLATALSADAGGAATALRQAVTRARNAADQLLSSGSRHALDVSDPVTRLWFDVLAGYRLTIRGLDTPAVG